MPSERNNPCIVCSANQKCCSQLSGLRLSEDEFKKYFKSHAGELDIIKNGKTLIVFSRNNGPCPYWEKSGCVIYDDRPFDCRFYPYEITRLSEKRNSIEVEFTENPGCPQKDCLLIPVDDAKALAAAFCRRVYGQGKPLNLNFRPGKKVSPFFDFLHNF